MSRRLSWKQRRVILGLWLLSCGFIDQVWANHCSTLTDPYLQGRCVRDHIEGTGAIAPGSVNSRQSAVPQYSGGSGCADASCAGAPGAGYFSDNGDVSGLNSAAGGAIATDPNATAVQQMQVDANGWNLTTSSPVTTANTVAGTITPSSSAQTCSNVSVCVSWSEAPPTIQSCTRPGSALSSCRVEVINSLREVPQSGGPSGSVGWCVDHYMYVRVIENPVNSYVVQFLGTDPGGTPGVNCGGVGWRTLTSFSFTPPIIAPDEQLIRVNFSVSISIGGQCGSRSFSISSGQVLALVCGAGGAQGGSIVATRWNKNWVIRKDVIDDRCAGFRSSGWVVRTSTCLDNAPRQVTSSDGTVFTFAPPSVAPANNCWLRDEEWGYTGTAANTCDPLLRSGCSETGSLCTSPLPGGCDTYTITMACGGGTVCTQQNIVQQCTSCGAPGSLVPYCTPTDTPPNTNFQQAATMMALIKEVQNGFDKDNLRIFSGTPKECDYSNIASAIVDCCSNDPDSMFGSCSQEEISLAGDKRAKKVVYVGSECLDRILGICVRSHEVYCSFTSKLGRMVQEQGKPQIGQNFGTPSAPDCDGFTVEEFASLNFQAMNWSEFFSDVRTNYDQAAVSSRMRTQACSFSGASC